MALAPALRRLKQRVVAEFFGLHANIWLWLHS